MKFVLLIAVFCTLFALSFAVNQCANPFWLRRAGLFLGVNQLTAPKPKPNTLICPDIPDGADSCCDQGVYDAITIAFLIARKQITDAQAAIRDAASKLRDLEGYINQIKDAVSNAQNLTDDQKDLINGAIDDLYGGLVDFVNSLDVNWAQCATGILRYYAGLFCYACIADWDRFAIVTPTSVTVIWDTTVCTRLKGDCIPFLESIRSLIQSISNAFQKLRTLFGDTSSAGLQLQDLCSVNGDCPTYICTTFIVGFTYDRASFSTVNGNDNANATADPTIGKRIEQHSAYSGFMNTLNKVIPQSGDVFAKMIQEVAHVAQNAHDTHMKIAGDLYKSHTRQATTATTTYQDNGYNVYDAGVKSNLETQVDSAATLASWLSFLW